MKYRQLDRILFKELRIYFQLEKISYDKLQEIRLRIGQPVILYFDRKEYITPLLVMEKHLKETIDYVCQYSMYAYENELKQGFITIEGGHRIGVAGQVMMDRGSVKRMNYIAAVNIRISHEIIGCADELMPNIVEEKNIHNTLIISPPRCGKTTILRDMIRQISNGNAVVNPKTVGIVDERSELAGCYHGIPQNHVGMRSDVLDGCEKTVGMMMLIRSMAPEVLAIDEIGAKEDVPALQYAIRCGVKILATIHGETIEEMRKKPYVNSLLQEKIFGRYVILKNGHVGRIETVYDGEFQLCCQK